MAEAKPQAESSGARLLKSIMGKLGAIAADLEELEDELPAPSVEELKEMVSGKKAFTYEAVFLGIVAMINVQLDEAIVVFWEGFGRNLKPDNVVVPDAPRWFFEQVLSATVRSRGGVTNDELVALLSRLAKAEHGRV